MPPGGHCGDYYMCILLPRHVVKFPQFIRRSRSHTYRVPPLQISCIDLIERKRTRMLVPVMATRTTGPIVESQNDCADMTYNSLSKYGCQPGVRCNIFRFIFVSFIYFIYGDLTLSGLPRVREKKYLFKVRELSVNLKKCQGNSEKGQMSGNFMWGFWKVCHVIIFIHKNHLVLKL